jgi:hypothetical protein
MAGLSLLAQVLVTSLLVFLFLGSVLGLALGLGLVLRAGATLPLIGAMNRWVSTRQALAPLETPLRIAPGMAGGPRLGALLIAIGCYSAAVLVASFDVERVAQLFGLEARYSLGAVGLDTLKWTLIAGSAAAVLVGILMVFFPELWRRIEFRANRWHSTGRLEASADRVVTPLERIVEAYPRAAGAVLSVMSLVATAACAVMLYAWR